ncbi:Transposase and inactivated derivatives [Eikenella corrodens]|uniref:Transposase and inactivated derivatives n=3 Tax=Eikenella corrodens TaxID=539 RepID=A0A8B4G8I7_EIKCO|nr:IS1595 family transposase [Eikenella corrodens]OAM19438.1 transposase [Eikenella corrodens]UAK74728.1 IS1595 family transposase [Eikenella corrodens]SNW08972.1 Transposase and inactivated derivatives [Eikenella corrodens]
MNLKNKYQKFSKITEPKFRQLLRLFALDLTASDTAKLTGVSIRSVNNLYLKLRRRLADECGRQAPLYGIVELDESYFGAKRIRGKRGRGAGGKTIVFGILKRGDKVYTEIVPDASKATLQKVIRGRVGIESVINTDGWRGYQGLVDMGFAKHFRVHHGDNEFVRGTRHINGIENFWNQAKRVLRKYNGIDRKSFPLFLKECEFRFNFGTPSRQLKILREWCGI